MIYHFIQLFIQVIYQIIESSIFCRLF